jgi:hypothetical protein
MGAIYRNPVLVNHIAPSRDRLLLDHMPQLREYRVDPAMVEGGVHLTPREQGLSRHLQPTE